MKLFFSVVLLVSLLLSTSFLQAAMADSSYCASRCAERCSKAGLKKRCLQYCGICCGKCKCVPSGTYGNKYECPCYANMLCKHAQLKGQAQV